MENQKNERELDEEIAGWEKVLPSLRAQSDEQTRKFAEACASVIAQWAPGAVRAEAEKRHPERLRAMGKDAIAAMKRDVASFGESALELVRAATSSGIDDLRPSASGVRDPVRASACEGLAALMKRHGFEVDPKVRLVNELEWSEELLRVLEPAKESARILAASEHKLEQAREAREALRVRALWDEAS